VSIGVVLQSGLFTSQRRTGRQRRSLDQPAAAELAFCSSRRPGASMCRRSLTLITELVRQPRAARSARAYHAAQLQEVISTCHGSAQHRRPLPPPLQS